VLENLLGFVDHSVVLDADLAAKRLFPSINVASVLGRPAARYRPHVLRALTNRVSSFLLQSERFANTTAWGREFGLDTAADEGEIEPALIAYRDKVQLMLSGRMQGGAAIGVKTLRSMTEQLVLLYAAQKDDEMLACVSTPNVPLYRRELLKRVKLTVMPGTHGLFQRLEEQVQKRVSRGGNPTQGTEQHNHNQHHAKQQQLLHDAEHVQPVSTLGALDDFGSQSRQLGVTPAGSSSHSAVVPPSSVAAATQEMDQLFLQLHTVVQQFNDEWMRKHEM